MDSVSRLDTKLPRWSAPAMPFLCMLVLGCADPPPSRDAVVKACEERERSVVAIAVKKLVKSGVVTLHGLKAQDRYELSLVVTRDGRFHYEGDYQRRNYKEAEKPPAMTRRIVRAAFDGTEGAQVTGQTSYTFATRTKNALDIAPPLQTGVLFGRYDDKEMSKHVRDAASVQAVQVDGKSVVEVLGKAATDAKKPTIVWRYRFVFSADPRHEWRSAETQFQSAGGPWQQYSALTLVVVQRINEGVSLPR